MALFNYVAKDRTGHLVRAEITAPSRFEALASLRLGGLTVVDLVDSEPAPASATASPRKAKVRRGRRIRRISRQELSFFCRQLAIAVDAGLPIRDALETINDEMDNLSLKAVLARVIQDLHDGLQFSEAVARYPRLFGPLFVALMKAAEESGSMPQTLQQLASYMERSDRLARKIRSITAYPLFVLGFFSVVCLVMTIFIVPQFQAIFAENKGQLPLLTRAVFSFNTFFLDHALLFAAGGMALAAALVLLVRTPAGRLEVDRLKLRLPFFGTCLRKYAMARICRTLSIMLRGGVAVTTAMEVTSAVSSNRVLERAMLRARDRIIKGLDMSGSLGVEREFPRLVIRMIGVGESSGQLPQVMEKVADGYEDQVEGSITIATSLFEPVVICVFGGLVMILVLAIYMPIFSIARVMQ